MTLATALRPLAWAAGLIPLAMILWAAEHHRLGPDTYRGLTTETGVWTIWLLCGTLVVTPLRRLTGWNEVIGYRRTLGLLAFFYGTLHFLAYLIFDRFAGLEFQGGASWWKTAADLTSYTAADIIQRPFLAIGFVSFLIMVPLAASSSPGMIRRLGGRRWRHLHRFVYAAAITGLLHHWWPLADRFRLDSYSAVLSILFAFRIYRARTHARPMAWSVH